MRCTYANALVWAVGNGLVSTTLVIYLALDLGAGGVAIAWITAAPRLAGLLRLAVPALLAAGDRRGWGRKPICLGGFAASCLVLTVVPLAAWGTGPTMADGERTNRLVALAAAWCVYHLLEYAAGVALWSWIGDLYPRRLRSRLLGRRERWLTIGRVVGIGASILLAAVWASALPAEQRWAPLAASAAIGAVLMLGSLIPLAMTTALATRPSAAPAAPWRTLGRVLSERPYRRLLLFSCWFSFANGLSASAQAIYPGRVLGIPYQALQGMRVGMWAGQSAIAPWCGRWVARHGALRLMSIAQLIVATGPLWFWFATPDHRWWIVAAFVAWIAYAALNVGLDTLKLNLADQQNNAPYLAAYYAVSDLANAVTTLLGGLLFDTLTRGDELSLEVFAWLFLGGWVCRTLAAPLIWRLEETPAGGGLR